MELLGGRKQRWREAAGGPGAGCGGAGTASMCLRQQLFIFSTVSFWSMFCCSHARAPQQSALGQPTAGHARCQQPIHSLEA